jgi:hypothetical protein
MKYFVLICTWLMISQISFGQQIYQIRADSVRIYNVCDTAELILENRTQGVSGFLFNKGRGRTEFRKVRLEKIGNSQIAISGQDTLDLSTLPGLAGVDTIYRSGDNIVYKKNGQQYSIATPAGTSNSYIQNQTAAAQSNSSFWINNAGIMKSLKTTASIGAGQWDLYTGAAPVNTNIRWTFLLNNAESGSNTGGDLSIQRYADNNGGLMSIPLQINRATGIVALNNGFRAANQSGITGTGTGNNSVSILSFYENNGSTQVGYVGKASTGNTDIYLTGNMTGVALLPANGIVTMANSTSNLLTFGGVGLGAPTFTTRSPGTKITLKDNLTAINTDYALGTETDNMWLSVPQASAANGFKWYAGTTLLSRMDGTGVQEWNNMGRFKGYVPGGSGAGAEIYYGAGFAYLTGFDRTNGVYTPVVLQGGTTTAGKTFTIDGTGFKLWPLPNIGLLGTDANGYLTDKSAAFAPATGSISYIQNQNAVIQSSSNFWISGAAAANRFAAYAPVASTSGDFMMFEGNSAAGANLRWRFIRASAEGTGNTGNDLLLQAADNNGQLLSSPIIVKRSTGMVTMSGGINAANGSGIMGNNTVVGSNTSILEYNLSDNITRTGYSGTILGDAYLVSENNNVHLRSGAVNASQLVLSPTSLTVTTGQISLANGTSNWVNFNGTGVGAPTFLPRSTGTKLIMNGNVSATAVDCALGVEGTVSAPSLWYSVPQNNNAYGFKWYGGTTQIARLDGTGALDLAGQGRFKGWYTTNGDGPAAEVGYSGGNAYISGFNRTTNAYIPLILQGGSNATPNVFRIDNGGYQFTNLTAATSLGTDASGYLINTSANFATATHTHTLTLTGAVTGTGPLTGSIATTLTAFDAAKITTGTIAAARLGTGTASSTTFLRGDGTWQIVSTATPTLQSVTTAGAATSVAITSTNTITSTGFYQSSLRSLKQNIYDYTRNATDIINHIKIREFQYKSNPGQQVVGIIADDEPEIISGRNHDRFDMMNAVGLLLKSVQELSQQNENIKQTTEQLQTENDHLKKQLQSLAERMENLEKKSSK